jgi:hypothetical protein
MGYYIKYNELRNAQKHIFAQINQWTSELENARQKLQDVAMMQEMQGEVANSIRKYILEIHIPLVKFLQLVLEEYKTKMQLYANDYYRLDTNQNAKIETDRLDEQISKIHMGISAFQNIEESVSNAIGMAAGLASVHVPSGSQITNSYQKLGEKATKFNIMLIINSQNGKSNVTITTYRAGSIANVPAYQKLQKTFDKQKKDFSISKNASYFFDKKQLSKMDNNNLEKSVNCDKVFISENGKYVFYHGEVYPIYVPDYTKQAIDAPWKTIETKDYSKLDFDWAMAFFGIAWDDVGDKELYTKDMSNKLIDNNAKGQGLLTMMNLSESFIKSLDNTIVTVNFQESNGNKRAIISVYNSSEAQKFASLDYNKPISKRAEQKKATGPGTGLDWQSDYAKGVCELVTGEKCKDGIYDIEVTLDERHNSQGATGFLSYDENGQLLYNPVVFSGDKAVVGTRSGLFETNFEPIADFSDYLNQPSHASEDYQKILEKVLEGE